MFSGVLQVFNIVSCALFWGASWVLQRYFTGILQVFLGCLISTCWVRPSQWLVTEYSWPHYPSQKAPYSLAYTHNLEGELAYRTALSNLTILRNKTTHSPFEWGTRGGGAIFNCTLSTWVIFGNINAKFMRMVHFYFKIKYFIPFQL